MLLVKQTKHPIDINLKYEKQIYLPKGIILVTARKKCDLREFIILLREIEKTWILAFIIFVTWASHSFLAQKWNQA